MPSAINITPRLFGRKEAAAYLGIGTTKFDELRKKHELTPKLIDGLPKFDRFEIDAWIDDLPHEIASRYSKTEWDEIDGTET